MLDHIILLTAQTQQQFALSELLKVYNPRLRFHGALNAADLLAIDRATLRNARLLAFTSGTIVEPEILDALGHGAYNFHPGPPDYPGWAPAHFALYERAKTFGATAHLMVERVDAGPIVGVETFPIPDNVGVRHLEQIAYVRLAYLFWRMAKDLATRSEPLPSLPITWSGTKSTKQQYVSACQIPTDISKAELEHRVRAFHDDFRAIHPTINLHGFQFQLVAPAPAGGSPTQTNPPRPETPPAPSIEAPSIAAAAGAFSPA
jgi:methionyl-tRNA formyltransferase